MSFEVCDKLAGCLFRIRTLAALLESSCGADEDFPGSYVAEISGMISEQGDEMATLLTPVLQRQKLAK